MRSQVSFIEFLQIHAFPIDAGLALGEFLAR